MASKPYSAASFSARSTVRLKMSTRVALIFCSANAAALAVPPAPQMTATSGAPALRGGALASSWFLMPSQSVLSPRSLPSLSFEIVFTAPMRCADSVSECMCGSTLSLCGMVTEPPPHPTPLIVRITSATSSVSKRSYVK